MVNLARLLGPALSGIILEKYGAGTCFILNAISFVAVILSLISMRLPPYKSAHIKKKVTAELIEGFTYLKKNPSIGMIMIMLTSISLLVLPYNTLLPVFAKVIYNGNAATFGYINSFIGLGAITGSFFLASLKPGTNLKMILLVNTLILGFGLIMFSHISYFPLAMLFAIICGFGTMSQSTICNTIIQSNTEAGMRGRVMSIVAMSLFGMLPIGSLLIGGVSQKTGAPNAILCQGVVAIIIALSFSKFLRKETLHKKEIEKFEEEEDVIIEKI